MLTLKDTKQFQAIVMLTRSVLETTVEMRLIAVISDSVQKIGLFVDLQKLKSAKKAVAFKPLHPEAKTETKVFSEFIAQHEVTG
jgi:hypothetical protein